MSLRHWLVLVLPDGGGAFSYESEWVRPGVAARAGMEFQTPVVACGLSRGVLLPATAPQRFNACGAFFCLEDNIRNNFDAIQPCFQRAIAERLSAMAVRVRDE